MALVLANRIVSSALLIIVLFIVFSKPCFNQISKYQGSTKENYPLADITQLKQPEMRE